MKKIFLNVILLLALVNLLYANTNVIQFKEATTSEKQYEIIKSIRNDNNTNYNKFYLEVISGNYPYNVKREAILGLEDNLSAESPAIAENISVILKNEHNELLIEEEINLLGNIGNQNYTQLLIPFLSSTNVNIREASVRALYHIGSEECVEPVKELLKNEKDDSDYSHNIRKYCMLILAKYRDKSSVSELEDIFSNKVFDTNHSDEALYAIKAIENVDEEKAESLVNNITNNISDTNVKTTLVEEIAKQDDETNIQETNTLSEEENITNDIELKVEEPDNQSVGYSLEFNFKAEEDALEEIENLKKMAEEIANQLKTGEIDDANFMRLGNIYMRIGDIYQYLKDTSNAKDYFNKAKYSYKKKLK